MSGELERMREAAWNWHKTGVWKGGVSWLGVPIWQNPADLLSLQMILHTRRPDMIIETGTAYGGLAVFWASIGQLLDIPLQVVTVDISQQLSSGALLKAPPSVRERIVPIEGDSVSTSTLGRVQELLNTAARVMVSLDSDHSYAHVTKELEVYSGFVTPGQFLVCQDGNIDINRVDRDGPHKALTEFVSGHPEFLVCPECELGGFSFFPDGYLLRAG